MVSLLGWAELGSYAVHTHTTLTTCITPSGEVEADMDSDDYNEWDYERKGDFHCEENLVRWPYAFLWTCCGEPYPEEGCKPSPHERMTKVERARH